MDAGTGFTALVREILTIIKGTGNGARFNKQCRGFRVS